MPATGTHLAVFCPDDDTRHGLLHQIFATAMELGGPSPVSTVSAASKPVISRSWKTRQDRPDAPHQGGLLTRQGFSIPVYCLLIRMTSMKPQMTTGAQASSPPCAMRACRYVSPTPVRPKCISSPHSTTSPEMHGVLCLFEGVVIGAADGYGRIAGTPAATLLHLGPGMGNGLANLHNARRAHVPLVNVVGDHATYHKKYDAPLESDIEPLAEWTHGWVRRIESGETIGADAAAAVAAAQASPAQVATLILPADISWSEGGELARPAEPNRRRPRTTRSSPRSPKSCAVANAPSS